MTATRIERRTVASLKGAAYNPRHISAEALAGLRASVARFGLVQPIIVNDRTGNIVGGHQRARVLLEAGEEMADVVVVDLPKSEEKALNVALNNPHIAGEFTDDLAALLAEVSLDEPELFEELRLDELLDEDPEPPAPAEGEDDVPEVAPVVVTVPGDLWLLGEHRLLCGDSTVATDVERALGGAAPFIMVTDPPYGVEYDPGWRNEAGVAATKRVGLAPVGAVVVLDLAGALFPGDVAYVWHAIMFVGDVAAGLDECGFQRRSYVIWAKSRFAISRGHYHWQHEPAWYAVRKGKTSKWCGDRKQSTLWSIPLQSGVEDDASTHGTQKPVECMRRPMRNHGAPGDVVYEPFCGSGTTIIAAETCDRACAAIEIDPAYVDLAVRRWQKFTGKTATLDGGRTFDEVAAERADG